ncbi:uncharacterized protein K452DRAFT_330310 [Aplosporella prunicola CBS 121167]|uniref:NADH-ubiquinone oxidoreductase chain 3 n=1 Tax=Aplosporella prunicola CBS 121167 TaxID=1176127 RepID=A0A6A6AWJ7_9PEZI|nr:uncharacterized protein K452DRAFT_330310 [Aplosporella prunicola CBS 121167]KAF2135177.1 hypothetical protein K452DRAFT_330310 [Aplosporella prunicola CBS 121167]
MQYLLYLFSFAGIPPLMGFFAKQMVFSAALDNGYVFITLVAILTSVVSAVYYLAVIKQVFFDKPDYKLNSELSDLVLIGNIQNSAVMTSTSFFFIFIPILSFILLAVNLILAPHSPYEEKDSAFECGFHSFLGQNRTQFSVSFFIFALLFLLFDLEILLIYPYAVSSYTNGLYGLSIFKW